MSDLTGKVYISLVSRVAIDTVVTNNKPPFHNGNDHCSNQGDRYRAILITIPKTERALYGNVLTTVPKSEILIYGMVLNYVQHGWRYIHTL